MNDMPAAIPQSKPTSMGSAWRSKHCSLGIVLAVAGLAIAACGRTYVPGSNEQIPSLRDLYPQALEMAQIWTTDAHLIWAEVSMEALPEVVFAFNSVSDPGEGALVHVEEPADQPRFWLEEVPAPGRTEALPAIELPSWGSLDSPTAYSISLDQGGKEFLERNPGTRASWIRLQYVDTPSGGGINWRVTFGDPLSVTYDVLIDPSTGEVVQSEESP